MGELQTVHTIALSTSSHTVRLFAYARKKAERMIIALYFVTDLLSEQEPLRWETRKKSLSLLHMLISPTVRQTRSDEIVLIKERIGELDSLIGIARATKLISDMNADLLQKTCSEIKELFNEVKQDPELTPDMLDAGNLSDIKMSDRTPSDTSYRTSLYDKKMSDRRSKGHQGAAEKRQQKIIEVVRDQGTATASDIKKTISTVSSKTLQRDLAELVDDGILKRTGRRRWTTYSLI